jgi:hypothetical protein
MNWGRIGLSFLIAAIGTSLADWFFFGALFHDKYKAFPEVWRRPQGGKGEGKAVGIAAVLGLLTPLCFILLCAGLGLGRATESLALAFSIWLGVCIPLLVGNHLFIKLDSLILVAHSMGWLVKLLIAAAAVAIGAALL